MSGKVWKKILMRAKSLGFEITICYVALNSPEIANSRIAVRKQEGGHAIPRDVVSRRFYRSLNLFFSLYQKLCDNWYFFDNSLTSAVLLAYKENSKSEKILNKSLYDEYRRYGNPST